MKFKFIIAALFLILFIVGCTDKKDSDDIKETFYEVNYITYTDQQISSNSFKSGTNITSQLLRNPNLMEGYYFDGWYLDSNFITKLETIVIKEDLTLFAKWIKVKDPEEVKALNSIYLVNESFRNLILPDKVNGFEVIWLSSNTEIFSDDGVYKYIEAEKEVTLKAMIFGDEVYEREFIIMAKPYPYEEEFDNIFNQITFPELIKSNIELITKFNDGIKGVWETNKPEILSNNGTVLLTKSQEEVTLALTLSIYGKSSTKTYTLTTAARELNYKDPEYFINNLHDKGFDVNETIMNASEIASFNNTVIASSNAKTLDLEKQPTIVSGSTILNMINSYSNIDKYTIYNHETKTKILESEKSSILNNRNLDRINTSIEVGYAVSTTHTVLRSYPTMNYSNSEAMDRFQETGFSAGTPMLLYHKSLDNNWYFVQMFNYYGWVPASSVGECSRDVFLNFLNPNKFIVVLDNILEINNEYIRMGYKLPYSAKSEDDYTIIFPTRTFDGFLLLKDIKVEISASVSDGYIPYTYSNLLNQGYKFVGISYSWGDKFYNGLDCSSTMAAIYACFGFQMGRNTSNQWATETYGKATSMTNEKLKSYQVGTLLYTSSHVLMYIGVDKDGNCWMLHNTSTGNICKLQTLSDYGESKINHTLELHVMK